MERNIVKTISQKYKKKMLRLVFVMLFIKFQGDMILKRFCAVYNFKRRHDIKKVLCQTTWTKTKTLPWVSQTL